MVYVLDEKINFANNGVGWELETYSVRVPCVYFLDKECSDLI